MPIGGFVIMVDPKDMQNILSELDKRHGLEVYGSDPRGNIVVVMETDTADEMELIVREISRISGVLSVGLTYLHAEDEVEKIEKGEFVPKIQTGKDPLC